jgi:hypothetical protein
VGHQPAPAKSTVFCALQQIFFSSRFFRRPLSRAILEYVYSAPYLAEQAKKALEKMHKRNKKPRKN